MFLSICSILRETSIQRRKVYCAFIDFKKAFDTVDHKLLYNKLYHLGLSSKIINIIRQIYNNAYLTLEMNGNKSSSIKINRGVL